MRDSVICATPYISCWIYDCLFSSKVNCHTIEYEKKSNAYCIHSVMHHYKNPYIVERLGYNENNFRRREIHLVTVDECPFDEERHHVRRDDAFYPRVGILTDLTSPFPFFEDLFTARYIPIYSLVIGFAKHCVASAREISARDRSFQPSEKFMSCAGCKTRERKPCDQ